MKNLLSTYKGLPREIYILFIGKIVNCLGAFVQPLMSLILTQKLAMSAGEAGEFVTLMALCQVPYIIMGGVIDSYGIFMVWIIVSIICAIGAFGMLMIKRLKNVNDQNNMEAETIK